MGKRKQRPVRDRRTEEQKREDDLRNSAAVRGISYEELLRQIEEKQS